MTLRRKCNGAKRAAEALDLQLQMVGERSSRAEAVPKGIVDCGEVIMLT